MAEALAKGVFPTERFWIDFKRQLYPNISTGKSALTQTQRHRAIGAFAVDAASMAIQGGYLVYGVNEDKTAHSFSLHPIPLLEGIRETLDQVAQTRITPPLMVSTTLLKDPSDPTRGLLLVAIPESGVAPHMVAGVYYGRSDTGNRPLSDSEVEELIARRGRVSVALRSAMDETLERDLVPEQSRRVSHFYLTAIPTQPSRDMFAGYTTSQDNQFKLVQLCVELLNAIRRSDAQRQGDALSVYRLTNFRRTATGTQLASYQGEPQDGVGEFVEVDDDGPIRYVNLAASTPPPTPGSVAVFFEATILLEVIDTLRLIGRLAREVDYFGDWLVGIEATGLTDLRSQTPLSPMGVLGMNPSRYDRPHYQETTRARSIDLAEDPLRSAAVLLRKLLRGFGSEHRLLR